MSQLVLTPLAYLLAFAGAVGLSYSLLHHFRPRLADAFHQHANQIGASFDELYFSSWKPTTFVAIRWLGAPVAAAVVMVATRSWVFTLLVGLAVFVLPGKWLAWKLQTRREKLEAQIGWANRFASRLSDWLAGFGRKISIDAESTVRLPVGSRLSASPVQARFVVVGGTWTYEEVPLSTSGLVDQLTELGSANSQGTSLWRRILGWLARIGGFAMEGFYWLLGMYP